MLRISHQKEKSQQIATTKNQSTKNTCAYAELRKLTGLTNNRAVTINRSYFTALNRKTDLPFVFPFFSQCEKATKVHPKIKTSDKYIDNHNHNQF